MATFLAVLPGLAAASLTRRPGPVLAAAAGVVALAGLGRRRAGGTRVFPAGAALLAPVWVLERAACSWLALGLRLAGGVTYAGRRIRVAAHSRRRLSATRVRDPGRTTEPAGEPAATVTAYEDGPLVLRGDFAVLTPDGGRIDPGRRTVALCRCGKSALKPFCDGTHKVAGFTTGPGRPAADGGSAG
jgi:CDGSH-type Zn-finger protein